MNRKLLPNDQWEHVKALLPDRLDNRLFLETVWWIAQTGSPWSDLFPAFGNGVYVRYSR